MFPFIRSSNSIEGCFEIFMACGNGGIDRISGGRKKILYSGLKDSVQ
jgi:hypothetical protein